MAKINYADIQKMYEKAFHRKAVLEVKKLSGGFKSEVYLINDGNYKVVLKLDSQDKTKLIMVDRNIMWWEAEMLQLMNRHHIPSPEFLFFDNSCEIVSVPYLFMSYIPGYNYFAVKNQMSKRDIESVDYQLGNLAYQICSFRQDHYFLPSKPNQTFQNNYEFVYYLFESLFCDANSLCCFDRNIYSEIYEILKQMKENLIQVSSPCLSHTDMWDGNILVSGDKITGLIDFADMYSCDELMTFYFHPIDGETSVSFLKGFQNKELSCPEKTRIDIYRMYVMAKMIVNGQLMNYEDLGWMYDNLNSQISHLSRVKK